MKIIQISVFLENRKGKLSELCSLLGDAQHNIYALTIAETDAFAVLRVIVNEPQRAITMLKKHRFVIAATEVVAVEIPHKPGGLSETLQFFESKGLTIEYLYGFAQFRPDKAIMAFRFDDPDHAITILTECGMNVITQL